MRRDRKKHPSPNSGIPEAAVAGALGIQLGGFNFYQGQKEFRPYLGDAVRELTPSKITESLKLSCVSSLLMVTGGLILWLGGLFYGT